MNRSHVKSMCFYGANVCLSEVHSRKYNYCIFTYMSIGGTYIYYMNFDIQFDRIGWTVFATTTKNTLNQRYYIITVYSISEWFWNLIILDWIFLRVLSFSPSRIGLYGRWNSSFLCIIYGNCDFVWALLCILSVTFLCVCKFGIMYGITFNLKFN